jgi:S1-C subfamily serine protease/DNA-binding response OmpR family regulator
MTTCEKVFVITGTSGYSEALAVTARRAGFSVASVPFEEPPVLGPEDSIAVVLLSATLGAASLGSWIGSIKGSLSTRSMRVMVLTDQRQGLAHWLDMGADDVMAWPGEGATPENVAELLARIRAQLRLARQIRDAEHKAQLAEEGQKIAHTAFQALAVTEKMAKDAFSLDRRLRLGLAVGFFVVALMTLIFVLFFRTASRESERAYAAIRKLEMNIAGEAELLARVSKLRLEIQQSAEEALKTHRQDLEQQTENIRERMAAANAEEVAALRRQLSDTNSHLLRIETEGRVAQTIIRSYSPSVCLLHAVVAFRHQATGKRLRFAGITPQGEPLADSEGRPAFDLDGNGPEVRADFFGTGFLVSSDGRILTNRHVAEPWWKNDDLSEVTREGFEPVISEMNAYFPGEARAIRVLPHRTSPVVDLAVVKGDLVGLKRLPLALDARPAAVSGQPVILMGYATGLDAILARAGEDTVRSIMQAAGGNPRLIMAELARRNLIRPLTTQGHLGDVLSDKIVYDAQTTHGGSGGPLFNVQGKVIAVNFAVVRGFGGSNFGIPVRYAAQLLK